MPSPAWESHTDTDPHARARVLAVLLVHPALAPAQAGELAELADLAARIVRTLDPADAALRAELAAGSGSGWAGRAGCRP